MNNLKIWKVLKNRSDCNYIRLYKNEDLILDNMVKIGIFDIVTKDTNYD